MEPGQANSLGNAITIIIMVAAYIIVSFPIVKIAQRTNHQERAFWGWIPILNILLMLKIAGKAWWWIFLCLIPFVNIVIITLVWGGICKARNKNPWLALLTLVPFVNIIFMYYLAFAD